MTNHKDNNGTSNHPTTEHNQSVNPNNVPKLSENKNEAREESVVFILRQIISLLKLSLQTSSKVVNPAIQQFLQAIVPTFLYYYEQLAPIRLQEWLQIYISVLQNFFSIISQTQEGKQVLSQLNAVSSNTVHFLTSVNTRQLIIETVGVHVKALEALNTPQMKRFLTSLPVLFIRILDNLSSGDAKLLYHSIVNLIWSTIELLGKEETTLAFAEVTALLVNALERERESRGPWNRRRSRVYGSSKGRRVKLASRLQQKGGAGAAAAGGGGATTTNSISSSAASNSKRRRERNKFIAETYTNRILLRKSAGVGGGGEDYGEGDVTVEDAILSSLGDGTPRSENAWLTTLGRREESSWLDANDGASSLPSRVVLPRIESREDEVSVESIPLDDLELESDVQVDQVVSGEGQDDNGGGGGGGGAVDISYLRKSIKSRNEKGDASHGKVDVSCPPESTEGMPTNHLSTESIAGSSILFSDEFDSQHSIEDLEFSSVMNDGNDTSYIPVQESIHQKTVELEHESDDDDNKEEPFFKEQPQQQQQQKQQNISQAKDKGTKFVKGTYSSTAHFYRTLDEIQNKLRQKAVLRTLKVTNGLEEYPGVSSANKTTGTKWQSNAAAAAGAGNEQGQNLLRRKMTRGYSRASSQPIRFRPRVESDEEIKHEESKKMTLAVIVKSIFGALPMKRKLMIGGVLAATALVTLVWFILGCYGLYYLVRETLSKSTVQVLSGESSTVTEIVLRIVQDQGIDGTKHKEAISKAAADAIKNALNGEL